MLMSEHLVGFLRLAGIVIMHTVVKGPSAQATTR